MDVEAKTCRREDNLEGKSADSLCGWVAIFATNKAISSRRAIVFEGGKGSGRFEPKRPPFMGFKPDRVLPLNDQREEPRLAKDGCLVLIPVFFVKEGSNRFCANGAADACFFVSIEDRALGGPRVFDRSAVRNDPTLALAGRDEYEFERAGFREA